MADEEVIERFPGTVRFLQIGMIDEGADVILIAPEATRVESIVAVSTSVLSYRRRRWPFDSFTPGVVARELRALLDERPRDQPIIFHSLSITAAPLTVHLASAFGAEFVANVASTGFEHDWHVRHGLDRAATLIVPAAGLRDALLKTPLASKTIELVHPGVMPTDEPAAFRDSRTVPSIVFAGSLGPLGGADVFLRAIDRVARSQSRLLALVCGKGDAESDLRRFVQARSLTEIVTFTGRLEKLHTALSAADVFCAPRALPVFREEPLHAMSTGLAVIAADRLHCDGLVDRENAILIHGGDDAELARELERLLGDPETGRRLGAAAQATARSRYSIATMVSEYARVYHERLIQRRTIPIAAGRAEN